MKKWITRFATALKGVGFGTRGRLAWKAEASAARSPASVAPSSHRPVQTVARPKATWRGIPRHCPTTLHPDTQGTTKASRTQHACLCHPSRPSSKTFSHATANKTLTLTFQVDARLEPALCPNSSRVRKPELDAPQPYPSLTYGSSRDAKSTARRNCMIEPRRQLVSRRQGPSHPRGASADSRPIPYGLTYASPLAPHLRD